jgi:septum formation protein
MSDVQIVLASTSSSRRTMLEAVGLAFAIVAPNVDEDLLKDRLTASGANGSRIADALAQAKALAVSERYPAALVIGADQILMSDGRILSKASDKIEARKTLRALRGREHELICAAVMARAGHAVWRRVETATMRMREFSDEFLDEYLTVEIPDVLGSVGCYRIEGRGAQLFSELSGDHFCIRGLPLVALLAALREEGALLS